VSGTTCQQAMSQPRSHPSPSDKQYAAYTLPQGSSIQLEIVKHPDSSKPSVACDLCDKLIEMTASGSLSYFSQHRGSKSCKRKERVRQAAAVTRDAQIILQTLVPSRNTVPSASHQSLSLNEHLHDVPLPALPPGPLYQPFTVTSLGLPSIDNDELSDLAVSMADLRSSSPVPDIDSSQECTGVLVEWTAGSVWDTYPYHQHGVRNHPWEPIGFEGNDNWRLCCRKCAAIPSSSAFRKFVGRATDAAEHTPYLYLTKRRDWREDNNIPDTDEIEEMREDLKRARVESNVSGAGRVRKSQRV